MGEGYEMMWKRVAIASVVGGLMVWMVGCERLEQWGFEAWEGAVFECDLDGECPGGYFCDDGICEEGAGGGGAFEVSEERVEVLCLDWCWQRQDCYGADPLEHSVCMEDCEEIVWGYVEGAGEVCGSALMELDECAARLSCEASNEQSEGVYDHCAHERRVADEACAEPVQEWETEELCAGWCEVQVQCFGEERQEVWSCGEACAGNLQAWHDEQSEACVEADVDWWACLLERSCSELAEGDQCEEEARRYEEECE